MRAADFFRNLVEDRANGVARGVCSICSAHPEVIAAGMEQAREDGLPLLVESTANQVNQSGGYTGMRPEDFHSFVHTVAGREAFPAERIILGGDHLGPYPWRRENAAQAMDRACELVRACVRAGYGKIHLDASTPLGGDPVNRFGALDPGLIARREAAMAAAAEAACWLTGGEVRGRVAAPVYVVGTEVPAPGGMRAAEEAAPVTRAEGLRSTVTLARQEFLDSGLQEAWRRVVAVVVQPGVEFGDDRVCEYDRLRAKALISAAREFPELLLEGHSTDYQRPESLRQLVEDGVAILKVGPALTFALRECLFALEAIERELLGGSYRARLSQLSAFLEKAMADNPVHWQDYYTGTEEQKRLARRYSLSDRSRYYWTVPMVQEAVKLLVANLSREPIPPALLSQYLPLHYQAMRSGYIASDSRSLLRESVRRVLRGYSAAVQTP
jgi:D-tagatose-1,6-bisphosphate aldolase subunit GatZ/KbaZ